jgi:hypothetical protein
MAAVAQFNTQWKLGSSTELRSGTPHYFDRDRLVIMIGAEPSFKTRDRSPHAAANLTVSKQASQVYLPQGMSVEIGEARRLSRGRGLCFRSISSHVSGEKI